MEKQLAETYRNAGQSQVLSTLSELNDSSRTLLESQLKEIDPMRVNAIYKQATEADSASSLTSQIQPPPAESVESIINLQRDDRKLSDWFATGMQAVQQGQVAVILLAGGQGTRLGSSAPKGCYDVGLPSHKSLFQLQAERILALQKLASPSGFTGQGLSVDQTVIPWYIMTSGPTRRPTQDFFNEHQYFGLNPKDVLFFEQGVLPCLDNSGKILLDSASACAVAPDGNGGIYEALRKPTSQNKSSVLEDAQSRGIKYFHTFGVDNCLVRVADPVFLGYCISQQTDCGVKVVRKTDPSESVGVVARKDGKWAVVEYSEIPKNLSQARVKHDDPLSELVFRAANIANHFFTIDFLQNIHSHEASMPYHIAHKKIPFYDPATKQQVKPSQPNGVKMERFIFDVFPFAKQLAVFEVERKDYFSPLKNAPNTGVDDPQTSRRDLLAQHKRWLEDAGATVPDGIEIELSPLVSYSGERVNAVSGQTAQKSGMASTIEELEQLFA